MNSHGRSALLLLASAAGALAVQTRIPVVPGCFALDKRQSFTHANWELESGWYQDSDDDGKFGLGPVREGHSLGTGPTKSDGHYLFFDASGFAFKNVSMTTCEPVPLGGTLGLRFYAYGRDIQDFEVQTSVNGPKGPWETLFSISGDQGEAWFPLTVELGKHGQLGYVRIFYRNGRREAGDLTVDDIKINSAVDDRETFHLPEPLPDVDEEEEGAQSSNMPMIITVVGVIGVIGCCALGGYLEKVYTYTDPTHPTAKPMGKKPSPSTFEQYTMM
jgi:hypothetical protein